MDAQLQIHATTARSVRVLRVVGEVDLATERQLESAIVDSLDSGPVVVDLHGVPFFAISGLSVLLRCRRRGLLQGHVLVVAGPRPQLQRLMRVAQLGDGLLCVRSVRTACLLAEQVDRVRNPHRYLSGSVA